MENYIIIDLGCKITKAGVLTDEKPSVIEATTIGVSRSKKNSQIIPRKLSLATMYIPQKEELIPSIY